MQAPKQADQDRIVAAKVLERYFALPGDRIENDIRRSVAWLQRPLGTLDMSNLLLPFSQETAA